MQPLTADEIHGTWGTVLLPINTDDTIDFSRLSDQLDALLDAGVDGVYCNGTAGEFETLDDPEFDQIAGLLADHCERRRVPFQIGASAMSTQVALHRISQARAYEPSAIQVILPDWRPVSDAEAIETLKGYSDAACEIGLVLYNPPHAKRVLSPESIGVLASSVPRLIGVKVAGSDPAWYEAMREHAGRLSLFVAGHKLATGVMHGASGAYSNVACFSPAFAMAWQSVMHKDIEHALRIERRIGCFINEEITPLRDRDGYGNAALDKLLCVLGGWADVGTRLRWPYRGLPNDVVGKLRPLAEKLLQHGLDQEE